MLEPGVDAGVFDEVGWDVMLGDEADGFPGGSPQDFFADNAGFWASQAVEHPETDQLLVFSSDINNGSTSSATSSRTPGPPRGPPGGRRR